MLLKDDTRGQAIAWAVRTNDPDFDGWESFTQWLEESPAHAQAYDEAQAAGNYAAFVLAAEMALRTESRRKGAGQVQPSASGDATVVSLDAARNSASAEQSAAVPPLVAANDSGTADNAAQSAKRWWPVAVAASLALVASFTLWPSSNSTYIVETAHGETGVVALEDGSRIDISGGSRLLLDRDNPRFASLEQGQALFHVVHDDARPFVVEAGDDRLLDAGTVFDVSLSSAGLTVGVSEGLVIYNPEKQAVSLEPGTQLTRKAGAASVTKGTVALAEVGEWREGRLTFKDANLTAVAEDLSRTTGLAFAAAPGAAPKALSGSILVEPVKADPASLGPLLGVSVRQSGKQWLIGAP